MLKGLGRKLLQNQKTFVLNNILRTREMLRHAAPGFKTVAQNVPYLLQVNQPNTPGFIPSDNPAMGIWGLERSGYVRIFRAAHPDRSIKDLMVRRPRIQSLVLIGSTGSIGHTSASDLDYWVCVDQDDLPAPDFAFLKKKLDLVSDWARRTHGTEVHFFLMDLDDVRLNRMSPLDDDSSGDVMPRLLKEEFYRTMLHVAGRLPLWWVVPPETAREDYEWISRELETLETTAFQAQDYVDLGYPESPKIGEYLGAAMWQVHKAQNDPFKAVIKMALLLEDVESDFTAPVLCEQVKQAVLTADHEDFPIDPYLMTIQRVLAFTGEFPEIRDLVRLAAWFKLSFPDIAHRPEPAGRKKQVLDRLQGEWGWSEEKVRDLENYPRWPERRKQSLGEELNGLLLDLYFRIAVPLRTKYPRDVEIQSSELSMLNAKVIALYARHQAKVEDLPSIFYKKSLPADMNIVYESGEWKVYDTLGHQEDFIFAASRAARVAAWLVHNGLVRRGVLLRLRPGDAVMKKSAFFSLLPVLQSSFPPLSIGSLKMEGLYAQPSGRRVLILNMETGASRLDILSAEVVYRTNQGEMCHEVLELEADGGAADKYAVIADNALLRADADPEDIELYIPPGEFVEELAGNLRQVLKRRWSETQPLKTSQTSRSAVKLDLGD